MPDVPVQVCHVFLCCVVLSCWIQKTCVGDEAVRPWHAKLFYFFSFSSAVDTGGGLVVVCMTSFTSMLGVTSYVRLLNCYMGHQLSNKSHFLKTCFVFFFFFYKLFIVQVRTTLWSSHNLYFLHRQPGDCEFASHLWYVDTISQAKY